MINNLECIDAIFSKYDLNKISKYFDKNIELTDIEINKVKMDFMLLDDDGKDRYINIYNIASDNKIFSESTLSKLYNSLYCSIDKSAKNTSFETYYKTIVEYFNDGIQDLTQVVNTEKTNVNTLSNKIENYDKIVNEKIQDAKDKLITLTVTVLGIFCSLTFSLSGSLGILNNVFSSGDSFAESLFKYSLIGIFVANLVFLLIYTISKINNKSIAMHCAKCKTVSSICKECDIRTKQPKNRFEFKKDCHGCEHKNTSCLECTKKHKGILCKLWNKFNYIFIINILCIFFLIFSFVLGVTGHSNFVFEREINNVEQSQVGSKNEHVVIIENKNQKDNVDTNLNDDVDGESKHPDELTSDVPIETPLEKSDN